MGEALTLAILLTLKDEASKALDQASGKFSGLGKAALAFGAAAAGAMAGLGAVLWDMAKAAGEEEQGITKLAAAVRASGADWEEASEAIEEYLRIQAQRTALDDGEARNALTQLVTITGDYKKSLELLSLAQDLSVAKGIDLASAAQLVGRVAQGNVGILSRYGIVLGENATAAEALAALQEKFAGQAEAYGQTFAGAQQRMQIAIGNLKETIGAALLPVLTQLFSKLAELAEKAMPTVERALSQFISFVTSNQPVLIALGVLVGVTLVAAFTAWAASAVTAAAATMAAMLPVVGPILAIVAAVGVLAAAWKNDWGGIRSTLTSVWEGSIKPAIEAIKNWFTTTLPAAVRVLREQIESGWNAVQDAISTVWAVVRGICEEIKRWFTETLPDAVGTLRDQIESGWNAIRNAIMTVWTVVLGVCQQVKEWFTVTLPGAVGVLRGQVESGWNAIRNAVLTVWSNVLGVCQQIRDWFTVTLPGAVGALRSAVERGWNAVRDAIANAWGSMLGICQDIRDWFMTTLPGAVESLRAAISEKIDSIKTALAGAWKDIATTATTWWNTIVSNIRRVFDIDWGSVGRGIIDGIRTGVTQAWDSFSNWLRSLVTGALRSILEALHVPAPSWLGSGAGGYVGQSAPGGYATSAAASAGNSFSYHITYIDQRPNGGAPDLLDVARALEWRARMVYG